MEKVKKAQRRSSRSNRGGSDIDSMFANGEPAERFYNLPSGTYEGIIKAGSALIEEKPDQKGSYRASCVLVVTEDGEYEDKEQQARFDLSTQIGVNIFLGELDTLEIDKPDNLRDAGDALSEMDGLAVRFWVSEPKDEFPPKVRFNEKLESTNGGRPETASVEYTKKDIKAMSEDELTALAKENNLNPDDYSWEELEEKLIEELV